MLVCYYTENFIRMLKQAHCYNKLLYIWFIRPHLDYCSAVWDPYLIKDVEILEKTQKFGLKMYLKDSSSDYSDLMTSAKIPTLSSRHSQARLTHMFKIMHEQTDFPDVPSD